MRKKKLLVFHPTIAPYRIDFFNCLNKEFNTRICLSYYNLRDQKFDYEKIISKFNFKPHYLKILAEVKNRVICKGYWKEIKEFKPDIVMVSEFGIDALIAIIYRKFNKATYKIVSVCDDSYDMLANDNDFSRSHKFFRKIVVPHLDQLLLVDKDVVDWYNRRYSKGLYMPIVSNEERVLTDYACTDNICHRIISQYNLAGKHLFLYVGRHVRIKNISTLIEAFNLADAPNSVLVIVGDGPERENLEEQANKTGRNIIFTGRLEGGELYAWYRIASCFVLPSVKEPFGAVTNEALIGGCKCLISNNAGSRGLISEGYNGHLFDPHDVKTLSQQINKMLSESSPVGIINTPRKSLMTKSFNEYMKLVIDYFNIFI